MIVIIGVGALGSHVALFLRNMEEGIKIVDFDRVEQKNILAQFHSKMGLGRNKAQALSQALQGVFGVKVEPVAHRLSLDNATAILGGAKLLLDCTDNISTRLLISTACRKKNIPCLHGCLSAAGDFARVVWEEHFMPDAEGEEAQATCIDGEHLPFFAAAAAYMAIEAQQFLKGGRKRSFQLTPAGVIRLA